MPFVSTSAMTIITCDNVVPLFFLAGAFALIAYFGTLYCKFVAAEANRAYVAQTYSFLCTQLVNVFHQIMKFYEKTSVPTPDYALPCPFGLNQTIRQIPNYKCPINPVVYKPDWLKDPHGGCTFVGNDCAPFTQRVGNHASTFIPPVRQAACQNVPIPKKVKKVAIPKTLARESAPRVPQPQQIQVSQPSSNNDFSITDIIQGISNNLPAIMMIGNTVKNLFSESQQPQQQRESFRYVQYPVSQLESRNNNKDANTSPSVNNQRANLNTAQTTIPISGSQDSANASPIATPSTESGCSAGNILENMLSQFGSVSRSDLDGAKFTNDLMNVAGQVIKSLSAGSPNISREREQSATSIPIGSSDSDGELLVD